jgi:hypothetical protein
VKNVQIFDFSCFSMIVFASFFWGWGRFSGDLSGAARHDSTLPNGNEEHAMRPREPSDSGKQDLFRARLDQIVDRGHELVKLAHAINWGFLAGSAQFMLMDPVNRHCRPC